MSGARLLCLLRYTSSRSISTWWFQCYFYHMSGSYDGRSNLWNNQTEQNGGLKETAVGLFHEAPLEETLWAGWWLSSLHSASFSEPTLRLFVLQPCAWGSGAQWLPVPLFAVLQKITTLFISRLHIPSLNWPAPLHSVKTQLNEDFPFLKKTTKKTIKTVYTSSVLSPFGSFRGLRDLSLASIQGGLQFFP